MEFDKKSVNGKIAILANPHFVAIPITLDFTNVTDKDNGVKIVKSGTPVKSASGGWVASNDGNATAILFGDVLETRPIGSGIIHGFINKANAEAASGLTYSGSISISQVTIL